MMPHEASHDPVAFDGNPVTSIEEFDTVELHIQDLAQISFKFFEPGTYLLHRGAVNFGIEGPVCGSVHHLVSTFAYHTIREEVFAAFVVESALIDLIHIPSLGSSAIGTLPGGTNWARWPLKMFRLIRL
jgi:hypothetical protein